MGTDKNGKGAMALGVILALLLGCANLIGGYVLKSVSEQGVQINALTFQVKLLNVQMESMSKERWTVSQQVQFATDLAMLNQTLRAPDVRRISREVQ